MRRLGATLALVALVACGTTASRDDGASAPGFPPSSSAALIRHLQPLLQQYGLVMTRASLIDLEDDYRPSPTGRHLALYATPAGEYGPERYVENTAPVTAALVDVFHRWPELESFDICQDAISESNPPPAVTRVNVPREDALSIDWQGIDLAHLLAEAMIRYDNADPSGLYVEVLDPARRHPAYREAVREAKRLARA